VKAEHSLQSESPRLSHTKQSELCSQVKVEDLENVPIVSDACSCTCQCFLLGNLPVADLSLDEVILN